MAAESEMFQTSQPSSLKDWLIHHPLVGYFVMAYGFAWLVWLPLYLGKDGFGILPIQPPPTLLIVLGPFVGPTLAAFIMTAVTEGKSGMRRLLSRYVRWHVSWRWYFLAILGVLLIKLIGVFLIPISPLAHPTAGIIAQSLASYLFINLLITGLAGGPLGEEPGWRGFALPRLQKTWGPLIGTLILGLLWGLWHVSLILLSGTNDTLLYIVQIVFATILITWVFNNTRGSLLLTILFHAANNASSKIVDLFFPQATSFQYVVGYAIVALLIIIFTKGNLSYKKYIQTEVETTQRT